MTLPAIQAEQNKIDDLLELVDLIQKSPELPAVTATAAAGYLTQHVCVRVAGFIEQAVRQIYYAYAVSRAGSSPVSNFVSRSLIRQQNLNSERLCQLAGRFDSTWQTELEAFLAGEKKEAVDSIVRNRHKIAHGESVSLGFVQMKDWYKRAVEVVGYIESQAIP